MLNTIFASQYLKSTLKAPQVAAHQLKNHSKKDPKSDPKNKQEKGKKSWLTLEQNATVTVWLVTLIKG